MATPMATPSTAGSGRSLRCASLSAVEKISIEKIGTVLPLGSGPHQRYSRYQRYRHYRPSGFGAWPPGRPNRLPDRLPVWVWATFRPKTVQDRQQRRQERSKTANIDPKSRWLHSFPVRVWAIFRFKTAQDRQQRAQERLKIVNIIERFKTANITPKSRPRPPT